MQSVLKSILSPSYIRNALTYLQGYGNVLNVSFGYTEEVVHMAVTVYTTPTCPHCTAAKRFLKEHAVPFRELDVTRNPAAAKELMRRSGQMGVPVIDVNGKIIVGFDRSRLVQSLGLRS